MKAAGGRSYSSKKTMVPCLGAGYLKVFNCHASGERFERQISHLHHKAIE